MPSLEQELAAAKTSGDTAAIAAAEKSLSTNRTLRFNNRLDAVVALLLMSLVATIAVLSVREWLLLLSRRKPARLRESEPVWLPERAVAEGGASVPWWHVSVVLFGLARELSNEAALERAEKAELTCKCDDHQKLSAEQRYIKVTNERFNGIRRCC